MDEDKYESLFQEYDNLFAGKDWTRRIQNNMQSQFNNELTVIFTRLYPKRSTVDTRRLPENVINKVRQKWLAEYNRVLEENEAHKKQLEDALAALAHNVDLRPTKSFIALMEAYTSSFETQEYGAYAYAQGVLLPARELLVAHGFSVSIEADYETPEHDPTLLAYTLVANASRWQLDALLRWPGMPRQEWIRLLVKYGLNPKVYDPEIPQKLIDKEIKVWRNSFQAEAA